MLFGELYYIPVLMVVVCPVVETISDVFAKVVGETSLVRSIDEVVVRGKRVDRLKSAHRANAL